MKIAIVGGTGNISHSISLRLLRKGHEVVCFNRGQRSNGPSEARTIIGDRNDENAFEQAMRRERFDAAIDMICFNSDQARSSVRAFQGVGHFIQCSTVCTYGLGGDLPIKESEKLHPISDYGRQKAAADSVFLGAWEERGFPVTIIKPSTTYGPQMGMLRQVAWDFSWIDRICKGKPILVCDEGRAVHQFLHVDDAALGFSGVVGNARTVGRTYNLVRREAISWREYHKTAMRVLGNDVPLVSASLDELETSDPVRFSICREIFAHDTYYDPTEIFRDVSDFNPQISLEKGMVEIFEAMERSGRIPNSDLLTWEDDLIHAVQKG